MKNVTNFGLPEVPGAYKALAVIDVLGEKLDSPDSLESSTTPNVLHIETPAMKAANERAEGIQANLRSLLSLPDDVRVGYIARLLQPRRHGQLVPEAGALVVDVSWKKGEKTIEQRLWHDGGSQYSEELATLLGANALKAASYGAFVPFNTEDEFAWKKRIHESEVTQELHQEELRRLGRQATSAA